MAVVAGFVLGVAATFLFNWTVGREIVEHCLALRSEMAARNLAAAQRAYDDARALHDRVDEVRAVIVAACKLHGCDVPHDLLI